MEKKTSVGLMNSKDEFVSVQVTYQWFAGEGASEDKITPATDPGVDSISSVYYEGIDVTSFALEFFNDDIIEIIEDASDNPPFW